MLFNALKMWDRCVDWIVFMRPARGWCRQSEEFPRRSAAWAFPSASRRAPLRCGMVPRQRATKDERWCSQLTQHSLSIVSQFNSPHQLGRNIVPSKDAPKLPRRISACKGWRWAFCRASRAPSGRLAGRVCSMEPSAWMAVTASSCAPFHSLCKLSLLATVNPTHPRCGSTDPSNAFRERLDDCWAFQRECSRPTRYRWISCSPWNWAWSPVRGTIASPRTLLRSRYDRVRDRRHVQDQNHKSVTT